MLKVALEDIMCDHPIKVKESFNVGSVSHLLLRYKINGILVVKDDNDDELVGIFTTTDLFSLLNEALDQGGHRIEELEKISSLAVGKVASRNVLSMQKSASVSKAIAIMHKKNVHTIPIYDDDKLVGVVGRHDVLNIALS